MIVSRKRGNSHLSPPNGRGRRLAERSHSDGPQQAQHAVDQPQYDGQHQPN